MLVRSIAICLLLTAAPATLAAQALAPSVRDSIRYRFADPAGHPGARPLTDSRTGQVYVLSDTIVLDGHGIDSVEVRSRRIGGDTTVDVIARLRPSVVAGFSTATASHIGQVLVVTIADRIVAAGVVTSRLGSVVPLQSDVRRSTADSLAARVNGAPSGVRKAP